jgi:hypothetical protein
MDSCCQAKPILGRRPKELDTTKTEAPIVVAAAVVVGQKLSSHSRIVLNWQQGGQMNLWKIAQNSAQKIIFLKIYAQLLPWKMYPNDLGYLCKFYHTTQSYKGPIGENSPNFVTLIGNLFRGKKWWSLEAPLDDGSAEWPDWANSILFYHWMIAKQSDQIGRILS